jgi:uncharacterized protein involved in exopolysaccharide biosynthesis
MLGAQSQGGIFAPPNDHDERIRELSAAVSDLRAQQEATQAVIHTMAATITSMHERLAATHEQITTMNAQYSTTIDTYVGVQASVASLATTVDRRQEPIKLLAAKVVKIAGVTLVGAAAATMVAIARRRDKNDAAGSA